MSVQRRPRVALVTHDAGGEWSVPRAVRAHVMRLHRDVDYVIVSGSFPEALRGCAAWQPVRLFGRSRPLRTALFFFAASVALRRVRADLVHAEGVLIASRTDVTTVRMSWTGFYRATEGLPLDQSPLVFRLSRALYRTAERWCFGRSRLLAALSEGGRRELERLFPHRPVTVIPNGIDLERFRPDASVRAAVRAEHGCAETDVVALFIGVLLGRGGAAKGLTVTIEGLARAVRSDGRPLRLWVLTREDPAPFRALAERFGVAGRVEFLGFTTEPERMYQAADLVVLPTVYETFSAVAFEGAACGLPLVATPVSGIEDLLADGEAGIVVQPTAAEVGDALGRLADDPELRARMGAAGRERASAYTWERAAERQLAVYRELLSTA